MYNKTKIISLVHKCGNGAQVNLVDTLEIGDTIPGHSWSDYLKRLCGWIEESMHSINSHFVVKFDITCRLKQQFVYCQMSTEHFKSPGGISSRGSKLTNTCTDVSGVNSKSNHKVNVIYIKLEIWTFLNFKTSLWDNSSSRWWFFS